MVTVAVPPIWRRPSGPSPNRRSLLPGYRGATPIKYPKFNGKAGDDTQPADRQRIPDPITDEVASRAGAQQRPAQPPSPPAPDVARV
jgi:hypothetical protein